MGKHGNKYQVNLQCQKIAKISVKTCMLFPLTVVYFMSLGTKRDTLKGLRLVLKVSLKFVRYDLL
jgi:hypothetical protein